MNLMNCCCQCVARIVKSITTIAPGGIAYYTDFDSIYQNGLAGGFPVADARWRLYETGAGRAYDGFGSTLSSGEFDGSRHLILDGTYPTSAVGISGVYSDSGVYTFFTTYPYSGFLEFQLGCYSGGTLFWPS